MQLQVFTNIPDKKFKQLYVAALQFGCIVRLTWYCVVCWTRPPGLTWYCIHVIPTCYPHLQECDHHHYCLLLNGVRSASSCKYLNTVQPYVQVWWLVIDRVSSVELDIGITMLALARQLLAMAEVG